MQAAPETQIEIIVRNSEEISIVKADPAGAGPAPGPLLPENTLSSLTRLGRLTSKLCCLQSKVVLFLVPKADTLGCTNQKCGFRDM
ncbi:hypothetical protein C8J55DRAFT_84641 [Lentinula edodes]|uniref:Uncharacterized protein n=1 Tax=Lentinula lateritia TaxID=40482 RepID=A0A9W9A9C3_9AGAR|nr:hypothetical protein C8J55DRAFT_84641 [Lentinula edodes]